MKQTNISFEVNQIDLYKAPISNNFVCNVQTPQKLAPRSFLPLPYSKEKLQFLKKFHFQYSDLNDSDNIQLCKILVGNKHCYAIHRNDVGNISTPFWITLQPETKLQKQRPTKVPVDYLDKLNTLLDYVQKNRIIKQIGSTPHEKPTYWTTFPRPLNFLKKSDYLKLVLDARQHC